MDEAPKKRGQVSAAEGRIRAKAEAMLRARYPGARIIHELVLQQGGRRIDLAALTPDFLACVEIKSENDVMDRLASQITAAAKVAGWVALCATEKHRDKIAAMREMIVKTDFNADRTHWKVVNNPDYCRALDYEASIFFETETGLHEQYRPYPSVDRKFADSPALLHMLWAEELRIITEHVGSARKTARFACMRLALEHMTGKEVRRGVHAMLMARHFPRSDPPVTPDPKFWRLTRPV